MLRYPQQRGKHLDTLFKIHFAQFKPKMGLILTPSNLQCIHSSRHIKRDIFAVRKTM